MPGNKIKDDMTENMQEETETKVEAAVEAEIVEDSELLSRVEELEQEKAQLVMRLQRMQADYLNFRRRSEEQKENLVLQANETLLADLLPVLDNFQRALESQSAAEKNDSFYQGVKMVYQGLLANLAKHGLEQIEAVDQPFNPNLHDAISMAGEGGAELIVLEEVQTGYLLNGKVLRHTKVLVGQNEEEDECQK